MTLTVSAPMRIAAICGLVFTVIVFGGFRLLGAAGNAQPAAPAKVIEHHPFGPGAKTHGRATATPAKPAAATKPKPAATKPKTVAKPKPAINVAAVKAARQAGLPAPLAQAFGRYRTVVVSLYDPYSKVDAIAYAEAKAAAALAGVGFVPLNVLSEAEVGKLTEQLGLLPDPGVLVYVRPATLAARIGGFADKETVAQAAANAAHAS
jgi:hypothetical protein